MEYAKYAKCMFDYLKHNIAIRSMICYGQQRTDRAELMNRIYNIANESNIFCERIEIDNKKDFASIISDAVQNFLRYTEIKNNMKSLLHFSKRDCNRSLTQVFTSIGEVARDENVPICFIINEIQCMERSDLSELISAIHRTNQLDYPIVIIGIGLPKIIKILSDIKSYSERLFAYVNIDAT